MPAFYNRPKTVEALVDQVVGKALDLLEVPHGLSKRWEGPGAIERKALPRRR